MFGLALWDRAERRLIVARDALGIKPIYYRQTQRELMFRFRSEGDAAHSRVSARRWIGPSLAQYLAFGYVSAPNSMFEGMRKLQPGTRAHRRGRPVHDAALLPPAAPKSIDTRRVRQWIEAVRAEMERAVRDQMVADVPIGAFLSGGIDSSAVVAFMSRHSTHPVKTYSIGFQGSSGAAAVQRAAVRAPGGAGSSAPIITRSSCSRTSPRCCRSSLWHMDEPIADAAFITTYLVSKFARQDVTVILSGVGGDELFGGYTRYLDEHYRRTVSPRSGGASARGIIAPIAQSPAERPAQPHAQQDAAREGVPAGGLARRSRSATARTWRCSMPPSARSLHEATAPSRFDDCIARAFAARADRRSAAATDGRRSSRRRCPTTC